MLWAAGDFAQARHRMGEVAEARRGGERTRVDAQATLVDSGVLAAGTHTVTITATGTKNAASSARTVAIDSAIVTTTQSVDDTAVSGMNRFAYGSGWGTATGIGDLHQGTAHWSNPAGAVATFTFVGTRVTIMGVTDVDQGISTYSVDGGPVVTKDDYAPIEAVQLQRFNGKQWELFGDVMSGGH